MNFVKLLAIGTAATICGGTLFTLGSVKAKADSEFGRDTALNILNPLLKETRDALKEAKKEQDILIKEVADLEITNEKETTIGKLKFKDFMTRIKQAWSESRKCKERFVGVSGWLSRRDFNSCSKESENKAEAIFKQFNEQ